MQRTDANGTMGDDWSPDQEMLDRYLTGESPAVERARLAAWLERHPSAAERLAAVQAATHSDGRETATIDVERLRERFWTLIAAVDEGHPVLPAPGSTKQTGPVRTRTTNRAPGMFEPAMAAPARSYAARVAIAAVILIVGWLGVTHQLARRRSPAMETYATANGQRATITLTDGTIVTLNVASRLQVPADYPAGDRTVRLMGEAMFTVPNHSGNPFVVLSGPTVTRVLGTSFMVRRYSTDTTTTVAVQTGKVAVDRTVVTQNQMIAVGSRGAGSTSVADPSDFGFVQGVLTLRAMSLREAIPELDRWYDADLRLGDARLGTKPVEGKVTAGSLADLVELLSVTLDARVVRDGRVLILYSK